MTKDYKDKKDEDVKDEDVVDEVVEEKWFVGDTKANKNVDVAESKRAEWEREQGHKD